MKKCIRLLSVTLFVLLLFVGCSGKSGNVTPSETPSVTQEPASATPTDSVEVTPTATPTQGIVFSDCLERMQPFEGDERKGFLAVVGVLDGHKVYNAHVQFYDEYQGYYGWAPVQPIWSKDETSKGDMRGPFLSGAYNLLNDSEYVFLAILASPTLEMLEMVSEKAHDAWIAEGKTEEDWLRYDLGGAVRREAESQAWQEVNERVPEALYAEGCPIIDVGEHLAPYVTTVVSKAKLRELSERGGETFNYIFYEESWLRWAEKNDREWVH